MGGNHQPYFVQIAVFGKVIGNNDMPDVNRVEGSEKKACLFVYGHAVVVVLVCMPVYKVVN